MGLFTKYCPECGGKLELWAMLCAGITLIILF